MNAAYQSVSMEPVLEHSANLEEKAWQHQRLQIIEQLEPIVNAHRQRKINGKKHPIIDFLFEYYHFKPSKLLEWTPGIGVYLQGNKSKELLSKKGFAENEYGVFVDSKTFPDDRIDGLNWTIHLLKQTFGRKPQFNCFGLHEWCMIYEKSDIRHQTLKLRLGHEQTRTVVEQYPVQCTHYDAFRFYSGTAVKFNKTKLNREQIPANEQPGCLHANMDLYRWAYKYHPWISSELIAQSFNLALEIRETDMRASPYCLKRFSDLPAIRIETPRGKAQYINYQKMYFERSQPLRLELLDKLRQLRKHCQK